jgi:hypothetical protein
VLPLLLEALALRAAALADGHAALAQVDLLRAELAKDRTQRGSKCSGRRQRREHRVRADQAQQAAKRRWNASYEAHGVELLPSDRLLGKRLGRSRGFSPSESTE